MGRLTFPAPPAFVAKTPVTTFFPDFLWPEEQFESTGTILDQLYVTDWNFRTDGFDLRLYGETELSVKVPGIDGIELVLGGVADTSGMRGADYGLRVSWESDGTWQAVLYDLSLTLRFDKSLLAAVEPDPATPGAFRETGQGCRIVLSGQVVLRNDWSLDFSGCDRVDLPLVMIGRSGVVISADDIVVDLSGSDTPPEIAALGFGSDFRGLCIREANVYLPVTPIYLGPRITFANCAIGSGGFSGDIDFDLNAPPAPEFFGYGLALQRFKLSIRQNCITASAIDGSVKLPLVDQWFNVQVALTGQGDFVTTYTENVVPPVKPQISKCLGDDGQIRLALTPNPDWDIAHYVIYRTADVAKQVDIRLMDRMGTVAHTVGAATIQYADGAGSSSPPAPRTDYVYRVTAVDAAGNESEPSDAVAGRCYSTAPPQPPILAASRHPDGSVTLEWMGGDPGLRVLLVRQNRSAGGSWQSLFPWRNTADPDKHTDTGLDPTATYAYRLKVMSSLRTVAESGELEVQGA